MMFINVMNEDIFDVTFSIYSDNQIIRQWEDAGTETIHRD